MKTNINYIFDEPVEYKELKIYPILMRDYYYFSSVVDCLTIDKNSVPNVDIISMTYFDYLIEYSTEENNQMNKFIALLYLCTKDENVHVLKKGNKKFSFSISDILYTPEDFEELRKIIIEQNLVDIPDFTIQKEIRDKIEEGKRIRERGSKTKFASLEDQMVALSVSTGLSLGEIYNMPVRKFMKSIARIDAKLHYEIYLQSSLSGFVEFKDKSVIRHWLSDLTKDKYEDDIISVEKIRDKISFNDKKNNGGL